MNGREIVSYLEQRIETYRETRDGINLAPEIREISEGCLVDFQGNKRKHFYGKGDSAIFYTWYDNQLMQGRDPSAEEILNILNIPIKQDIIQLELPSSESDRVVTYAADYAVTRESGGPVMRGAKFHDPHANPVMALALGVLIGSISNLSSGVAAFGLALCAPPLITLDRQRQRCLDSYKANPKKALFRQTPPGMKLWRKTLIKDLNSSQKISYRPRA